MMTTLSRPAVRCSLALLCTLLWGSAFPCIKIGYEWLNIQGAGSQILFAGYRFFLAGMITFAVACVLEKRCITVKKEAYSFVASIGFLQTTVQYVCFYISMGYVTGSKGSIISSFSTFAAIILAHFIVKEEHLNWQKGLGCLIGFAGVVIINLEGISGEVSFMGEGMMIISATAYGAGSALTKRAADRVTPMALTAYQLLFGGVLLIIIGFATGGIVTGFDVKSVILLIYMAIISSVGFSLWTVLIKYNPVSKVTVFGFCIPVFGVILSGIFLGESILNLSTLLALLTVSAGIIIVNLPGRNKV